MKWLLLAVLGWIAWRMWAAGAGPRGPVPGAEGRPVVVIEAGAPMSASRRWLLGAALVGPASVFPLALQWLLFTHGARQLLAWALALCWLVPVLAALLRRALRPGLAWACALGVLAGAGGLAWVMHEGGLALHEQLPVAALVLFGISAVVFALAVLREAGVGRRPG